MKIITALILFIPLAVMASGEWATFAITSGVGRIEIVSNYLLFSSSKSYDAKIPKYVKSGTRINIKYKKDNKWIQSEFVVAGISTKGKLCRLHNKLPSQYSSSPGDTIYTKPCKYK